MLLAFDTNIFIYWLDVSSPFFKSSQRGLALLTSSTITGITSVITITELRAGMHSMQDATVLDSFGRNLRIIPTNRRIAERAGDLRQEHPGLRTPDAIHLATAIEAGAHKFITNDKNLLKIHSPSMQLLSLLSL